MINNYDYLIRLLLIGDSGIGKSSLLLRFVNDDYTDTYINTIGLDFKIKTLEIDGIIIKLQIWDTAGQERFRTIVSSYFRVADGVILTYSTTNQNTFINLDKWRKEIEKYAPENVSIVLCGTKSDDVKNRCVTFEEGKNYADKYNYKFLETSSKENKNIDEIFIEITMNVIKKNNMNVSFSKNNSLFNNSLFNNSLFNNNILVEKKNCCI